MIVFGPNAGPVFAGDSFQQLVAEVKPAVIQIMVWDANSSPVKAGTGFFISSDGMAVTSYHVIQRASHLAARTNEGAVFQFERLVAHPQGVDLAILKFSADGTPFLNLGQSTDAVEGQRVLVIGSTEGPEGAVSEGKISAFRANRSMIQITAPNPPGSSGSPVINELGQVIAIATMINTEGQNFGFAIPVEDVELALVAPENEPTIESEMAKPRPSVAPETPSEHPPVDQTPPNPPQANPNETAESLLRAAATEYILSGGSPSLDREMTLYANHVDYYDQGAKSADEIRADLSRLRERWPSRRYEVSDIVRTQYDSKKDVGTVIVHYSFEVSNGAKRKTGEVETFLVFDSVSKQPRVILVKEHKVH